VVSLAVMLALLARVLTWHLRAEGSATEALTPHGERLFAVLCVATPCVPALSALWAALTRRVVTRLIVTLLVLVVAGAAVPVTFLFVLPPLFRGHFTRTVTSPDGTQDAHVFISGLLGCTATVYVSPHRTVWGRLDSQREIKCDTEDLRWREDGTVELISGPAQPLNLFLGPR
jgi:hypothetical protein